MVSNKVIGLVIAVFWTWLLALRLRTSRQRNFLFLVASYLFYASFGLWFLGVLLTSSFVNYAWSLYLRRRPTAERLWVGIAINLLLLSTFKYLPGIAEGLVQSTPVLAYLAHIVLPVGMSFWTFQALSYLLDIYQQQGLDPSLFEFCLYMAFAPTVLSGPICRLPDLLPQFRESFQPSWANARCGLERIWLGIFLMTLARTLATGIPTGQGLDSGFVRLKLGAADVWALAIGYGFQIFFDFAGYTHISLGVARLFGIRLPENFDRPYLSTTPSVFWTRWHMSLSFWIRDYLFLPLAMLRRGTWWRSLCLVISMVVFGLWHGARLSFLVWGTYHGLLLVLHRTWQLVQRRFQFAWTGSAAAFLSWFLTFLAICLGWIFFRTTDLHRAFVLAASAFSLTELRQIHLGTHFYVLLATVVVGYFAIAGMNARHGDHEQVFSWLPVELRLPAYAAMFYLVAFRAAQPQAFIYFRF